MTDKLEETLLPCPFCGSQATILTNMISCDVCLCDMRKLQKETMEMLVFEWNCRRGQMPNWEATFQRDVKELVMSHVDRMNDVCEEDTAENIIKSFTEKFDPIFHEYMAVKFPTRSRP